MTTTRIELLLNDERRGLWGVSRTLVVHKGSGESRDHVVLKVLGVVLFFHEQLVVEHPQRVGRYKSDVVRFDARGDVVQWIECGLVSAFKLDRLTRALPRDVVVQVLKKGKAAAIDLRAQLEEAAHPERVQVNAVDASLVDALAEHLGGTWIATVQEEVVSVSVDGATASGAVRVVPRPSASRGL